MTGTVLGRTVIRLIASVLLVAGLSSAAGGTAAADTPESVANKVHLRVLVLSDGSANVSAIAAELDREGVPTTVVDVGSGSTTVIDRAFLADDATHEARFQGIVLPGASALSADEMAVLAGYERDYGIREVVAYAYPNAALGMTSPAYTGVLDGSPLTVAPAGADAGFGYLSGRLQVDDIDASVPEVYGYLASGLDPAPAGESYVPLIEATAGGVTGSIVGVHTVDGRSQLVITAAFDAYQRYFQELGHGVVTWLTRGVHLGYQRNYFSVHVDDVFMADSQWSPEGRCTPGDDCYGDAAQYTTPDIRMEPADVSYAVGWQQQSGIALDMVFNGGGSDDYLADHPQLTTDPLVTAFAANAASFGWINHTLSHEYLGCIEVAPPNVGEPWHCATAADYADPATVFIEPELAAGHAQLDPASGIYFLTEDEISDQIARNRTWAAQHGIPIDPAELVTGEHSGLAISPQQPLDNPNLSPALAANQIGVLASDASREAGSRAVGAAVTVPRHPMNIFYNVSTYRGEVSEYNWYYTAVADGGGGACEAHPDVTQCISPLPDATEAEAESSFHSYILPIEVRNALSFVLSNDPRPFYVHQSNLTDQRILYPVLDGILSGYRSVYDTATTPLVHLTMTQQAAALTRMTAWRAAMPEADAYVDATGVHVDGGGSSAAIPITVPLGAAVAGLSVASYGGEQSGWIAPGAASGVSVGLPTPAGGYVGVPGAPAIGSVTSANAAATVTWTAGPDRGSPVTGYTVRAYIGANLDPSVTVSTSADSSSLTLTGLINFAAYSFTVTADSAVGSSDESARSATVIPAPSVPAAPEIVGTTAGDGTATVSWQAPDDGGSPVTLYTVRLYPDGSDSAVFSQDVAATERSATFTGLTNGTGYRLDVFAYNVVGAGPASARSPLVTPEGQPPDTTTTTPPETTAPPATTESTSETTDSTTTSSTDTSSTETTTVTSTETSSTATTDPSTTETTTSTEETPATPVTTTSTETTTPAAPSRTTTPRPPAPPSGPSTTAPPTVRPHLPGVPRVVSLIPGNKIVTLRWIPPADNGSPLTKYVISIFRPGAAQPVRTIVVAARTTAVRLAGLVNGVAYQFSVQAVSGAGAGPASGRSGSVIPRGSTPGRPQPGLARSGEPATAGTVIVRWSVPQSDGGSLVTGYVVVARRLDAGGAVISTGTVQVPSSSTRALQMTLSPGRYTFTVRAVNGYGMGSPSAPSNAVTVR